MTTTDSPVQAIPVYPARAFRVTAGANLGDPVSDMEELILDDIYELDAEAERRRLALIPLGDGGFQIAGDSELGRLAARVHLDCALQFMSPDGMMTEALILVETDAEGLIAEIYLLPLDQLLPKTEYALVGMNRETARVKFAQIACVSFSRGTRITLATGAQVRIEDLKVGDRVLTRDDGAQEIRWIGCTGARL